VFCASSCWFIVHKRRSMCTGFKDCLFSVSTLNDFEWFWTKVQDYTKAEFCMPTDLFYWRKSLSVKSDSFVLIMLCFFADSWSPNVSWSLTKVVVSCVLLTRWRLSLVGPTATKKTFAAAGHRPWNSFPAHLKQTGISFEQFTRLLKTFCLCVEIAVHCV